MTVQELINNLNQFSPNTKVIVPSSGNAEDCSDIDKVILINSIKQDGYYGIEYECFKNDSLSNYQKENEIIEKAVLIGDDSIFIQ